MRDAMERARTLKALHEERRAFIIANPWDAGSARLLEGAGFRALATTSAGCAFSLGLSDGAPGRDAILANAAEIIAATSLPVSADLENGFGHDPETVAETISRAIDTGLAGGSIEDFTGDMTRPFYDVSHAAERIRAAAEAIRKSGLPFQLLARAENLIRGNFDLDDTIARLLAYQEAGADMLYAPGLATREQVQAVLDAVDRPINVVMGLVPSPLTAADLAAMGVGRISVGSALARLAYGGLITAAKEMRELGTFEFARSAAPFAAINAAFARPAP